MGLNIPDGTAVEGPYQEWRLRDDPAYAGIRSTWAGHVVDPRLPFGRSR